MFDRRSFKIYIFCYFIIMFIMLLYVLKFHFSFASIIFKFSFSFQLRYVHLIITIFVNSKVIDEDTLFADEFFFFSFVDLPILRHIRDSKGARRACDLPCALDLTQWKRTLLCYPAVYLYLPTYTLYYIPLFSLLGVQEIPTYRPEK